jgi:hypothetical protein
VKRKSASSDDQIFDEEEKISEPQQKRVAPSSWITAKKEEAPPVAVKRQMSDQGECFVLFSRVYHFICVSWINGILEFYLGVIIKIGVVILLTKIVS